MGDAGSPGRPGPAGRYLSGLGAAGLGLCAAGWLVLTPFAFGYRGRSHDAALTDLVTGGALAAVCLVTLAGWAVAWRRALRADGVLARRARPRARAARRAAGDGAAAAGPAPDQVLTALRELVAPMLNPPAIAAAEPALPVGEEPPVMAAQPMAGPAAGAEPAAAEPAVAEPPVAERPAAEPAEPAEAAGTAPAGELPAAARPARPAGPAAARAVLAAARAGAVIPEPRSGAEARNGAGGRNGSEHSGGIAVIESMLARTGQLMPGYEEEETW